MDRRSFITALMGGLAAASVGGAALARAAIPAATKPEPVAAGLATAVDAPDTQRLDKTDAGFTQYGYRRRRRYDRRPYGYRRRQYRGGRRFDWRARSR